MQAEEPGETPPLQVTGGPPIFHNVRKMDSLYDDDGRIRPGVNVRTIIRIVRDNCPWLLDADVPTIRTWAQLEITASALFRMIEGVVDGQRPLSTDETVKTASELRQIRATQQRLADSMGLNPASRKKLSVAGEDSGEEGKDIL